MLYSIKNVSNEDIPIGRGILKPNKDMITFDLTPLNNLIKNGLIISTIIREDEFKSKDESKIENNVVENKENDVIKENLKRNLTEALFKFYFKEDLEDNDFKLIKWFYKNIGFTSRINDYTLKLIDEVENQEELIEILLNNVYPELLELYLKK